MTAPIDLHVAEHGPVESDETPTIVFSHGVGRSTSDWDGFVAPLRATNRLLMWDQPGHGRSPKVPDDAYGAELAYAALQQVVGSRTGVFLVGHSLGGYLSTRFALEHGGRVGGLVLIATGPGFRNPDAMAKWNDDIRRTAAKQGRPETLVGLHADSFVMDNLGALTVPTLLIVGSRDAAFLGATDYLEKKVPSVQRHTIDGAGHDVPMTHSSQLAVLIDAFVRQH